MILVILLFLFLWLLWIYVSDSFFFYGSEKAREFQESIYFCFIACAKSNDCVDHNKLWKILEEMGITDHLTCILRNMYQVRKQQLELDMEQQTGSK